MMLLMEHEELRHVDGFGIRDEQNVPISHLEVGRQEISARAPEARAEDNRNQLALEFADFDTELLGEFARLEPIKEHRPGIGLHVQQTTGLAGGFGQIDAPCVKIELTLLAGRAECEEFLLLAVDVNAVAGLHKDVVRRFVDEIRKRNGGATIATMQHHPAFQNPAP